MTAGGHVRWDIDDLQAQLRVMDRTAQHDATNPRPRPVVAAIVTSKHGVLVGRRNDGKPPWTFIAGEIETANRPPTLASGKSRRRLAFSLLPGQRSAAGFTRPPAAP